MPQHTNDTYEQLLAYVTHNPQDIIHVYRDRLGEIYITYNDRIPNKYLPDGMNYVSSINVCG